jgi:putative peptidoglycan lipid II flippase
MTTKKRLAKSTAIVSSGIMTSRILGFIRDILIAKFFGIGMAAQAFVMAFTLPNSLRHLVAEGAVNTAMVPILTEYKTEKDKAEFWRLANVLLNLFLLVLLLVAIAGVFAAPLLVRMIAPGFIGDHEKLTLTITLLRMIFPYVLLVGLAAYCMGVLHTYNHFAAPAFSTAVLNLTFITSMLVSYRHPNIAYLACAVIVGGILQVALQLPPLLRRGPFFNIKAGLIHKDAARVGKLLLPRMVGAGIYQINIIVDRILASLPFIGEGAVVALYYGNRLFQLPLALFGISMATAALPTMSSQAVEKDFDRLKETISFSLRNMLFFSIPASIGLMVLSRPIIKILFERDKFTAYATDITSAVLFFYAIGLIAYGGVKILVAAFYSLQDTRTPVKIAFYTLICNVVLNLILMIPLKVSGLALATSISGFVNFGALFTILRRKLGQFEEGKILRFFLKVLLSSLLMGLLAYVMMINMRWDGLTRNILNLSSVIFSSIAAYLAMSLILKIRDIKTVLSWIKKD